MFFYKESGSSVSMVLLLLLQCLESKSITKVLLYGKLRDT
jgi:hypothetical protein